MSNMDRIETAINNLIINENEAIKSRIEEVRYCIDIPVFRISKQPKITRNIQA